MAVAVHYVDVVAHCIAMVFVPSLHNLHSNKMISYIFSGVCFIDSIILVLEKYTFSHSHAKAQVCLKSMYYIY